MRGRSQPQAGSAAADGVIAGFWLGLWHGIIAPVTFAISLFNDTVNIYEVHNTATGTTSASSSASGGGASEARTR